MATADHVVWGVFAISSILSVGICFYFRWPCAKTSIQRLWARIKKTENQYLKYLCAWVLLHAHNIDSTSSNPADAPSLFSLLTTYTFLSALICFIDYIGPAGLLAQPVTNVHGPSSSWFQINPEEKKPRSPQNDAFDWPLIYLAANVLRSPSLQYIFSISIATTMTDEFEENMGALLSLWYPIIFRYIFILKYQHKQYNNIYLVILPIFLEYYEIHSIDDLTNGI